MVARVQGRPRRGCVDRAGEREVDVGERGRGPLHVVAHLQARSSVTGCQANGVRRRRRPARRRGRAPVAGVQRDRDDRVGAREPGTWLQFVTRPATMSCSSARLIEGTGLPRWETRQTPLRARRVSTRPRGSPGSRSRETRAASEIPRTVSAMPASVPPPESVEARRPRALMAVEVGQIGDQHLGDLLAAHADRLRRGRGRLRASGDAAASSAVPRAATARAAHVRTPPPVPTPRLPLRSFVTLRCALVSTPPARVQRGDLHARAAAAQVDGERGGCAR